MSIPLELVNYLTVNWKKRLNLFDFRPGKLLNILISFARSIAPPRRTGILDENRVPVGGD